jgi:uncharacterized membrane protein YozB (DUF420 family)
VKVLRFISLALGLDPVGNVALALQVAILFLLILGLPFVKGWSSKKNLKRHGYSTALAVVLHTILIFIVMVPSFMNGLGEIGGLSFLDAFNVSSHAVLGIIAEVLGVFLVVVWLRKGPSVMACERWRKWMMPTFIIWVVSVVGGALIHVLGMI